ncbi:hypothetical protein GQ457_18G011700 [Hibiscus cannabinus]
MLVTNNVVVHVLVLALFGTYTHIPFTIARQNPALTHATSGGEFDSVPSALTFDNPRLKRAYVALQAWKQAVISDPFKFTSNWVGSNVCNYTGVFCSPSLDDPTIKTVAGIDLNHGDIAGNLPEELGLLDDIALFHVNSNRFCGKLPRSLEKMKHLYELDVSNNRFAGKFPHVVLRMPSLKYLDLRFNDFEGKVPEALFEKELDAIFINHNRFGVALPENMGNSPASVIVLANNVFHGCLPTSMGNMSDTLNEIVLSNNGLHSCLPKELGSLKNLQVLDARNNKLMGELPSSIGEMKSLERLDLSHNMFWGAVPGTVCSMPNLKKFNYNHNFFNGEAPMCSELEESDDVKNCLHARPVQRSRLQCQMFLKRARARPQKCKRL